MIVKILPNDRSDPPNKLADAELLFEEGALTGLRLVGFAIWQNRNGHSRTVTVPARTYFVLGEKRAYALLRPVNDEGNIDPVRRLILDSYAEFEQADGGRDLTSLTSREPKNMETNSVGRGRKRAIAWDQRVTACAAAHQLLTDARNRLRAQGARSARAAVAKAMKSVDGAHRHAKRMCHSALECVQ